MINKLTIGMVALLTGCLSLVSNPRGSSGPSSSGAEAAVNGYEPAMLELDTVRDDDAKWRLVIAAGAHTEGDAGSGPPTRVALTRAGHGCYSSKPSGGRFKWGLSLHRPMITTHAGGGLPAKESES